MRGETVALPLAGVVDFTAEKARLDREIAKEKLEIAKVVSKLGNDDFVARAPEDIVAEHQDRLETFQARLVRSLPARASVWSAFEAAMEAPKCGFCATSPMQL